MYIVYSQYQGGIIHEAQCFSLEKALEKIEYINSLPGWGAWLRDKND